MVLRHALAGAGAERYCLGNSLAQATKKSACKEKDGGWIHQSRVLSHQGIVEGGTASDCLDMFIVFVSLDLLLSVSIALQYETWYTIQKGL
jgi:hypothetical protein